MTEPAIRVRGLGKRFTLGEQIRYATLRDTLAGAAARLWPSAWLNASGETIPDEDRFLWALRDVSFEIGRGEIVGIIGGNGAGKSTLLKILSRITEPTTGCGEIRGRVGSLLEVGTGFHSELSGRENLYLNGAILGMRRTEIDARFDEIVAFAEVAKFIDTPVKHYSSGMYLRLAFAVAAHLHPEILLVDEVLAVGDAAFQKKCLGKMEDVATQGRTVLFVSHNMAAVESLCSRVIWLRDGQVVEEGPPRRLISKYLQSAWANVVDRVWDDIASAPGNDKVRVRRARIRPSRTPVIEPVTVHTPFDIEFEYWNLQPGAALNLSLHIYNDQGIMVFNALPITETEWQGRPFPAGLFRDTCHVPGDLMNDGSHTIELLVVQDDATVIYRHKDILTLHVQDAADVRGAWFGKWSGAVRPMLEWRTQLLETSLPAGGT